jgi:hypothetical protein
MLLLCLRQKLRPQCLHPAKVPLLLQLQLVRKQLLHTPLVQLQEPLTLTPGSRPLQATVQRL